VIRFFHSSKTPRTTAWTALALAAALSVNGCSNIENLVSGDKVDYRSGGSKTAGLDIPPDLTQLSRDSRYQPIQGGAVSAAAYQANTPASGPVSAQPVAVSQQNVGSMRIERLGNQRWLRSNLTPEQLWPQLQAFWKERGLVLTLDQPNVGVMETEWAENRAKLPQDAIRGAVGKVFDGLYSTGERDKFRTRIERTADGAEVYITHRGMVEVFSSERKDNTVWQPRAPDWQLEAEMLSRLMLRLGATEEVAKTAIVVASTPASPARARLLADQPNISLQIDDGFERAWRRVGVALDRSGFTVEDRDRAQGIYYVRYIDPATAGKDEPGFLSKLFSSQKDTNTPARYRVVIKGEAERSLVTVQSNSGTPETGDAAKRITALLLEDLK
jgi:outer membrane protein assembly factor BamC